MCPVYPLLFQEEAIIGRSQTISRKYQRYQMINELQPALLYFFQVLDSMMDSGMKLGS